ncbi:hypothetical protein [Chryseobacterium lineare]
MEKLLNLVESIFDTIKDNGLFIFLAVLFPVLLYKVGAGQEIVLDLAYQQDDRNKVFFAVASFLFLGLSIWCIPTISIYIFKFFTKVPSEKVEAILDKLLDLYNAKPKANNARKILQIPVRYLAIIPWIIFVFSLTNVYFGKGIMIITGIVIFIIIKVLDSYSSLLTTTLDTTFLQFKKYWEILVLAAVLLVEHIILQFGKGEQFTYVFTFANILGVILSYLFFLVKENSEDYPDGDRRKMKMIHRKTFYTHIFLLIIAAGTMIIYYIKQVNGTINHISPITIGTMVMSFYILIIELFFTSQLLLANIMLKGFDTKSFRFRLYKVIIVVFAAGWVLLLFKSTNTHAINKTQVINDKEYYQRQTIEDHFENWYQRRAPKNGDSLEVYLVSGQGGGSRAGYWFLSNMYELDNTYKNFYDNLYSISTVSGSSSGAQMFLASKKYYKLPSLGKAKDVAKNIYSRNYLSSALYGLLIGDFIDSMEGIFEGVERDRNYYFQKEEERAFAEAHQEEDGIKIGKESSDKFFTRDFMYHYTKKMDSGKYKTPLFFLNTAIIENGKKAVFSPVELNTPICHTIGKSAHKDHALFTFYEDAYGIFRHCEWSLNKELPMSACVNASQAFPIINAYSFLHGVGRLADGGVFENSGTSTTMEVYIALKKYLEKNPSYKVKFTIINILNGTIDNESAVNYSAASILNTLTVMSKNPFTGHQLMAVKQLYKSVDLLNTNQSDRILTLQPIGEYTLSRMLSNKTIDEMRIDLDSVKRKSELYNMPSKNNMQYIVLRHHK